MFSGENKLKKMEKMNAKNLSVFFFALASVLLFVSSIAFVSANGELATIESIKVGDIFASGDEVSVVAGETVTVKVIFEAIETTSDVKMKVEFEGEKVDVEERTSSFNVEAGKKYSKTLSLRVPYELQDEVSSDLTVYVRIWNGDFRTEDSSITLRVQRPSYNVAIMSISSPQSVGAGELFPVDVVIKNNGYNEIDDMYATVKIASLGVERTSYFGDIINVEDDDNEDNEIRRFFLQIPQSAQPGLYAIEVEAYNSDIRISKTKQISITNEFTKNTFVTSLQKSVGVGEDADFNIVVVNPTNKLKVFRIVTESSSNIATSANNQLIAVPAGTSKTVTITATPQTKGDFDFGVSVFSGEELVDSLTLSVLASGKAGRSSGGSTNSGSVVALTIILVIIFLVLVGVLVALMRKKPEQAEELGESYY
jgi:preprotein translocase subunit YajC